LTKLAENPVASALASALTTPTAAPNITAAVTTDQVARCKDTTRPRRRGVCVGADVHVALSCKARGRPIIRPPQPM
jgi:hypothetical protein